MNGRFYTKERNVQIVLFLLKSYGIRRIIASPGMQNATFVASVQQDSYFEVYSSVDERSAAYIACGMAAESGEPVVLSCTGATAPRNYYSGLTEAFYRKLPIIAITATKHPSLTGHLIPQATDRTLRPKDLVVRSEHIQFIENMNDEWDVTLKVNNALHSLYKNGGGPIHLNLETRHLSDFSVKELPPVRVIKFIDLNSDLIDIPKGRVAIFIGAHLPMSDTLEQSIDNFCASYNAVVFCDHTSNYKGRYRVFYSLLGAQTNYKSQLFQVDLLIHIGEISGAYDLWCSIKPNQVWRISEDGVSRDTFKKLSAVFEMKEEAFFTKYSKVSLDVSSDSYLKACHNEYLDTLSKFPDIPFSNMWIAKQITSKIPEYSVLHLAILNTLRCWNFFDVPSSVKVFSNTGGFGIDGIISTLIGAALINPNKIYFGIVGDLAFFYDLNSMGNRHVGKNVRILLVNNGRGVEFRNPYHFCTPFGKDADPFMAAAGHYGNQSKNLIRHFATDLGYEYMTASNKEEFNLNVERFLTPNVTNCPMIFEVFTTVENEQQALTTAHNILCNSKQVVKQQVKELVSSACPQGLKKDIKNILNKIKN